MLSKCANSVLCKIPKRLLATSNIFATQLNNRTVETNPLKHNRNFIGKYYEIPNEAMNLFKNGGIPKSYRMLMEAFTENALMIRPAAVEIIEYLQQIDHDKPIVRFCLFGRIGTGKSMTLVHLAHYGSQSGYLLVHVPYVSAWTRRSKDFAQSTTDESCVDLPLCGGLWLTHFKKQNYERLKSLDLKLQRDYVWNARESHLKGSSILDLVEFGINRVKYSNDVVIGLVDELKWHATQKNTRIMVLIDGYNSFFYHVTNVRNIDRKYVHPKQISLTKAFLNITKHDWTNGVVVVALDEISAHLMDNTTTSYYPMKLLGRDGFEHLDPFVPVECKLYSRKEAKSLLDYYRDRKWLRTGPEHDDEIIAINGHNPYYLMKYCSSI